MVIFESLRHSTDTGLRLGTNTGRRMGEVKVK